MSTQRPRRPTEVTFPGDVDDDDKGDGGEDLELKGVEDNSVPVLKGKRKARSEVDNRVCCVTSLFLHSWLICPLNPPASETPLSGTFIGALGTLG
jgi:hypothetical protein